MLNCKQWTSRSCAKSVFLSLSSDKLEHMLLAPLHDVYVHLFPFQFCFKYLAFKDVSLNEHFISRAFDNQISSFFQGQFLVTDFPNPPGGSGGDGTGLINSRNWGFCYRK